MNRTKKLKLNVIFTVINQIIVFASGLIIPKLIIDNYGSEINGLVSSIAQFLSIIMFCEMGVGAVVQSALYKPISENNVDEISKIYCSSQKFFKKIAYILTVYIIGLCIVYPYIVTTGETTLGTIVLIGALAFRMFVQYYFSLTYRLILIAAQMTFVPMLISSLTLILNILLTCLLVWLNRSIQEVKIVSSLIFLLQPVVFAIAVNRMFKLDKAVSYEIEPIKQKWNGFAQHVASISQENSPVIILTVFTNVTLVSVYAVYHMIANGLKTFFVSFLSSLNALLGDMYAKKEVDLLNETFDFIEWATFMVTTVVYTVAAITIIPFVEAYIGNDSDVNYVYPAFGYVICLYMAVFSIRLPYSYMIQAAGHFKQTQNSAFIELIMSLALSCLLVLKMGLAGVTIGALIAITYRTIYYINYLHKYILYRNIFKPLKGLVLSMLIALVTVFLARFIVINTITLFAWVVYAIKIVLISLSITCLLNIIFYKRNLNMILTKIKRRDEK